MIPLAVIRFADMAVGGLDWSESCNDGYLKIVSPISLAEYEGVMADQVHCSPER